MTSWKVDGKNLSLDVTIPANTTAILILPAAEKTKVTESGIQTEKAPGIKFVRMVSDNAEYTLVSGIYHFRSLLPESIK